VRAEDDSISLHPPPEGHACRKIRVPPRFDRKGVPMVEVSHIATIWQMLNNLRAPTPHIRIGAGSLQMAPGGAAGRDVPVGSTWSHRCRTGSGTVARKRVVSGRGQGKEEKGRTKCASASTDPPYTVCLCCPIHTVHCRVRAITKTCTSHGAAPENANVEWPKRHTGCGT